jgi:hypothetical protein
MVTPVFILPGLLEKGGISMPRLSKKYKQEWQFFLDDRNRMKYNELCKKCERECKQSFRAIIIDCPFERKNRKKKKGGEN